MSFYSIEKGGGMRYNICDIRFIGVVRLACGAASFLERGFMEIFKVCEERAYPFNTYEHSRGMCRAGIGVQKEYIFCKNAERLLGL